MKISELSTDRALDVLCELTPYVANITGDKALLDELGKKFDTKGKSVCRNVHICGAKVCGIGAGFTESASSGYFRSSGCTE